MKEAKVSRIPKCDFCSKEPYHSTQSAQYDGKTTLGPWAFMCEEHFSIFGIGLGVGKGQKLVRE